MKNKGFTLIELLAVIIVLGIISLLAFPPIINQMRRMRDSVSDATLRVIYSATDKYMSDYNDDYPLIEDSKYCISLQDLVDGGVIDAPIYDAQTGFEISLEKEVAVDIGSSFVKTYELFDVGGCGYIDSSGAKAPVLSTNMIPIMRNEANTAWVKADVKNEWYNYELKNWANAVLVTQASRARYKQAYPGEEILESDILMYVVWIPRYRYKLFNTNMTNNSAETIEIIFEGKRTTKSTGITNGQWLTHPAFYNGSLALDGIWVGKFETSFNPAANEAQAIMEFPEENKAVIKPGKYAWRGISVYNAYLVSKELNANGNIYGLGAGVDPHLMKNTEWGATAYLSYSKYGNGPNIFTNPSLYIAGCAGTSQYQTTNACVNYDSQLQNQFSSTTGNIYGIYDMVGGAHEMVMGAMYLSGNINISTSSSGFTPAVIDSSDMNKYIDKYEYSTSSSSYNRSILGDAMGEVLLSINQSWNNNYATMPINTAPWIIRGEARGISNAGILTYRSYNGDEASNRGFRVVITEPNI